MAKKKITSKSFSFEGFDFKKWLISVEKPLVAIVTSTATMLQTQNPELSAVIGLVSTLAYNAIKYFVKEYSV